MEQRLKIMQKLEDNTLKLVLWGLGPYHTKQLKGNADLTALKDTEDLQRSSYIIGLRIHTRSLRQRNFLIASEIFNKSRILELY